VEKRWQVIHSGLLSVECVAPVDDARILREAQACTPWKNMLSESVCLAQAQ